MTSETSNFDCLALKDEGNALYSAGDFLGAVQKYSKALKLCADNNTDRTTLLKNRAAAYLNLQEYQKVIEDTTAVEYRNLDSSETIVKMEDLKYVEFHFKMCKKKSELGDIRAEHTLAFTSEEYNGFSQKESSEILPCTCP